MRIVGGKHKGRALSAPRGRDTRPTSDRTREAIFNILEHGSPELDLEGLSIVDLFAGTGALGLEALSRGVRHATFVDRGPEALKCCRANAAALGESRNVAFLKLDASRLPPPARIVDAPCGLAFLDPPYGQDLAVPALRGLAARGWLEDGAVCVLEVGTEEEPQVPRGYSVIDDRAYGAARILFLRYAVY